MIKSERDQIDFLITQLTQYNDYEMGFAKFSYEATNANEVTVKKHEKFKVHSMDKGWWRMTTNQGLSGHIPDYVVQIEEDAFNHDDKLLNIECIVISPYKNNDGMSLNINEELQMKSNEGNGWCTVETKDNIIGSVPVSHLSVKGPMYYRVLVPFDRYAPGDRVSLLFDKGKLLDGDLEVDLDLVVPLFEF